MQRWACAAVVVLAACGGSSGDLPVSNADCGTDGDVAYICGVINPEDVIAIPDTNFIVASGYGGGGGIHFISHRDRTRLQVYPTPNPRLRHDADAYPDCPGPIDPAEGDQFNAHGLNLRLVEEGLYHLYVVHHGFRESIEIFEIDTRYQGAVSVSPTPGFAWIGCVVAPESMTLNSVSPLPGGGFAATAPFVPAGYVPPGGEEAAAGDDEADGEEAADAGETAAAAEPVAPEDIDIAGSYGVVWEWSPAGGWSIVPGSESAGPNGIEASADGEWLYVNLWAGRQVLRLSRGRDPVETQTAELAFHPDNIRWQADGTLLTAGHDAPDLLARILECIEALCDDMSSHVARVDPDTLAVTDVVDAPATGTFSTATAALQVNDEIWVGSVRGDRIALYPAE